MLMYTRTLISQIITTYISPITQLNTFLGMVILETF